MKRKEKEADANQAALLQKIALPERQLKHEERRSEVLDKLIEVAEKQPNISIRKKPGTIIRSKKEHGCNSVKSD